MKTHLHPLLGWLMICLVIFAVGSAVAPHAYAQEEDDVEADAPASKKAGAAKGEAAPADKPAEENFLWWVAKTSGTIGAVLLVLSIYFVATVARMFMELRPEVLTPLDVLEDCEKFLQARDFTGLYKRLKADNSYFSTVVSAGIAELPNGIPEARDAMERVGDVNTINMERKISMLAVLAGLALLYLGWQIVDKFIHLLTLLLFAALRRARDVAITMAPIVLTGLLALGSCVLIGQPLNFANIIALPLLFGIGVAFHIYFVMSWRSGGAHLLSSSLARAIFFSALTTATGFGSLWLSSHPGTASMGKLLMISLVWTLVSALIFQPALMGPPREVKA